VREYGHWTEGNRKDEFLCQLRVTLAHRGGLNYFNKENAAKKCYAENAQSSATNDCIGKWKDGNGKKGAGYDGGRQQGTTAERILNAKMQCTLGNWPQANWPRTQKMEWMKECGGKWG
jgi:hypothetical protein